MNLWKRLTSIRTSALLLCILAAFLLLNVVVPQEAVIGEIALDSMVEGKPVAQFFMLTLGFGRIPVSPLFLGVLALFLMNLTAVLASRIGPTWRHIRLEAPASQSLEARASMRGALSALRPEGWDSSVAARTLRGHGFKVSRVGETVLWAVKHRTAPLGFLLFHFSFFLLFIGGGLIYYTRFVGLTTLIEGQAFNGRYQQILRRPPTGRIPSLRFSLQEVEARYEEGFPVHLGATLRLQRGGSSVEKRARVNHPASWGTATLLVRQAGLAPGFWLQDGEGYSLDRVAVAAKTLGTDATTVPLDASSLMLTIEPLPHGVDFPERDSLARTALTVSVTREEDVLFAGELRPGEAAAWENGRLVFEEIRYWAGIQVVEERGGGILIFGFLLGVVGLVWRLVWYRREVAVVWSDSEVRLVGKGEYYRGHFRHELEEILRDVLGGSADETSGGTAANMQLDSEDQP